MSKMLHLARPLCCLDLETTGLRVKEDRIVELSVVVMQPSGERRTHTWRLNPGCPIPAAATAIHGIGDQDVAASPRFAAIAADLAALLRDADLAGYNIERFDLPMLQAEFQRLRMPFPQGPCAVIDACTIFMRQEPRDLAAAYRRYCGGSFTGAHSAAADAEATLDVLLGQVAAHQDLGTSLDELDAFCHPGRGDYVDRAGKFIWRQDGAALNFGRHKGRLLAELAAQEAGYLQWLAAGDFPPDTQAVAREALAGRLPVRAATPADGTGAQGPRGGPGGERAGAYPSAATAAAGPGLSAPEDESAGASLAGPPAAGDPRQTSLWPD